MPLWSWANVVSLDAVAVGLLWQLLYTTQFCQRFPAVYELAIIGLSIWLVYTADRLFDAIRLDRTRPHTFRHRFHAAHQAQLTTIWFVALAVDTLLIVRFAHESQLRWGCSAIAIVVAYVTGIHLIRNASSWFPKELQAGMLFAFGVSLPAWSEISANGFVALLASVLMTGFTPIGGSPPPRLGLMGWPRRAMDPTLESTVDGGRRFPQLSPPTPQDHPIMSNDRYRITNKKMPISLSVDNVLSLGRAG